MHPKNELTLDHTEQFVGQVFRASVRISVPVSVIKTSCSWWTDREPSAMLMGRPVLLSGLARSGGNHGLQRDQHAGLPARGIRSIRLVAGSDIGNERGFMQLPSHTVAAKAADQVQAKLTFDQVLHRHRPIEQLSAGLMAAIPAELAIPASINARSDGFGGPRW